MPWIEVLGQGDFRLDHVNDLKLAEYLELIRANALWLKSRGLDQWQEFLGPMGPALIRGRFEEGQVFIAYDGGSPVGGVAIAQYNHRWSPEDESMALWVHSIVRHPQSAAKGLGAALLHWVEGRAKATGKKFVRIEVYSASLGLVRYYESHNYEEVERKPYRKAELILMEKKVR